LCVNPGRISKGKSGGTYAKLTVYPTPKSKSDDIAVDEFDDEEGSVSKAKKTDDVKKEVVVRVVNRTKVEIVRI